MQPEGSVPATYILIRLEVRVQRERVQQLFDARIQAAIREELEVRVPPRIFRGGLNAEQLAGVTLVFGPLSRVVKLTAIGATHLSGCWPAACQQFILRGHCCILGFCY